MTPRIFVEPALLANQAASVELNAQDSHYLVQVLRLKPGAAVQIFDGSGNRYDASLTRDDKRRAELSNICAVPAMPLGKLAVTLIQGIARGDRMDWLIEKSCELGVRKIMPVSTEKSTVRVADERADKKLSHWQRVAQSACAQCGQDMLPEIAPPMSLGAAIADHSPAHPLLCLQPESAVSLSNWAARLDTAGASATAPIALSIIVGPESGFTGAELRELENAGAISVRIGPRVLRTETAGTTALTVLQAIAGDLQ